VTIKKVGIKGIMTTVQRNNKRTLKDKAEGVINQIQSKSMIEKIKKEKEVYDEHKARYDVAVQELERWKYVANLKLIQIYKKRKQIMHITQLQRDFAKKVLKLDGRTEYKAIFDYGKAVGELECQKRQVIECVERTRVELRTVKKKFEKARSRVVEVGQPTLPDGIEFLKNQN